MKPVEIRRLQNGKWVIDFGRPLTGWMRLQMHDLKAGQEVQINYADIDDNRNARKLAFMANADGFQDFNQKDVFISAGKGAEIFCSKFNYHSFRYAVIAGLNREPSVNDAEAMMIEPDLHPQVHSNVRTICSTGFMRSRATPFAPRIRACHLAPGRHGRRRPMATAAPIFPAICIISGATRI